MGPVGKNSCCYSAKTWAKFAGVSAKKFRKLGDILSEKKLIILENSESDITIIVPNMTKFKDEWTSRKDQNSGVPRE